MSPAVPAQSIRNYSAVIVDDNEIDRLSTQLYLKPYSFVTITGIFSAAQQALEFLRSNKTDILFLDIDMPGLSGLDLRRELGNEHVCIFITSYPDYAVESFGLAALDFLVKPLAKERFANTMDRLRDYMEIREKAALFSSSLGADVIYIRDGHEQVKIRLHDILYLEALKDYTRIVTKGGKFCVLSVLGNLLQEKSFASFVRVHRSYAIQKNFVQRITSKEVILSENITLPIGRTFKSAVDTLISLP